MKSAPRAAETWIALLRGVNVGGKNKLPMKGLVAECEALGFSEVRTYIQSGNVVFRAVRPGAASASARAGHKAAVIAKSIGDSIHKTFGFLPGIIVLSREELAKAAASNPFPEAESVRDGKALHLFFLGEASRKIERDCFDAVKKPSERWRVVGSTFYLYTPDGFGTSKLAAKAERCLGVPATARNWRTVCELLKLAENRD